MTLSRIDRLSLIAPAGEIALSAEGAVARDAGSMPGQAVNPPWEEHLDVVYRYSLRLTRNVAQAHDLTQETMLRGWKNQSSLREPAAARVWLLRIATNVWTDWLRQGKHAPQTLAEPPPAVGPTIPAKLIQQEQLRLVLAALDELPPRQRQVMHLTTIEQLPQSEVARILEISPAAVKASLSAARKELRQRLQSVYEEVCGGTRCRTNE